MLQSYLNMLKVIQNTNGGGGDKEESLKFQIKVKTVVDEDVVQKVNKGGTIIYFFGDRFLVFMYYSRKCSIKAPAIDCKTSIYVLKEIFFEII